MIEWIFVLWLMNGSGDVTRQEHAFPSLELCQQGIKKLGLETFQQHPGGWLLTNCEVRRSETRPQARLLARSGA